MQLPAPSAQISGRRFLISRFRLRVLTPVWKSRRLPFLDSRFSIQTQGGGRPGDDKICPFHFSILVSGFKSSLAHCKSAWPPFLISRFQVPLWRPFKNSGASTFLDSPFWLLLSRMSREVSLDGFSIQERRLQMEMGIDHYSPPPRPLHSMLDGKHACLTLQTKIMQRFESRNRANP